MILGMPAQVKHLDVEAAKEDLKKRTLEPIGYDFARLIYLSSLRDFSTGEYHHDGLAQIFSEATAQAALIAAHQEAFYNLAFAPLDDFTEQIERFIRATPKDYEKLLTAWETLEAYRVTVPSICDPLASALFRSNVKLAITFLKSRRSPPEEKPQPASPHPSPDQ
jgi:hypothetical protein